MLRASLLTDRQPLAAAVGTAYRAQWLAAQRRAGGALGQRFFANDKKSDASLLPGSDSQAASKVVEDPPSLSPANPSETEIPASGVPKTPPAPEDVKDTPPQSKPAATPLPPTGTGTASVAPPPTPKRKPRRFRRFLMTLLILSGVSYAGGVYYSLHSDNFHDFFTEYVPFGEDAVGYFEERAFRNRFPHGSGTTRLHPQISGENKVQIQGRSGVSPRIADEGNAGTDLAQKGRHISAVEDNKPAQPKVAKSEEPSKQPAAESDTHKLLPKSDPAPAKKAEPSKPKAETKPAPAPADQREGPKPAAMPLIDNIQMDNASDPVVQDVVKILNSIITVVNADNAAGKYSSTINKAKEDLSRVVSNINTLKATTDKAAEDKIKANHVELDNAAKQLLDRFQNEMHDQETRWKEEYEAEREKLSEAYQKKLGAELSATRRVYDQRLQNELLEQSLALQKQFTSTVRDRVEKERSGRLAKLSALEESVQELEKLTAQWNQVVDTNLKTQHILVAVEAVRATLEKADKPTPFIHELAALKEIASDDPVINAAIASINPSAYQRGIPTNAQLIDRFRRVASEVRKASLLPENAGVASHLASLALSKVMFKKQGLPVGEDVESVLARTEELLQEGDLDRAAREMNGLSGWARTLSRDWLGECRRVLEVRQALDVISAEARLQSLLVE